MNQDGRRSISLGWNPIYLEKETPFRDVMPNWGVKIECDGEGCNGLPCAIDPAVNKVNEMVGRSSIGAGGASFIVVTVPKGVNANFVIFDRSGASGEDAAEESGAAAAPTPAPHYSAAASSSTVPDPTSVDARSPSPSWPDPPSLGDDSSSGDDEPPSPGDIISFTDHPSTSSVSHASVSSSTSMPKPVYSPHQFFENTTSTHAVKSATANSSVSQTSPTMAISTGGASSTQTSTTSLLLSSLIVLATVAICS